MTDRFICSNRAMKQTASARSFVRALADNTAGRSSIRRRVGDGDVNLADVWPKIMRVGARRAEPEPKREGRVRVAPPRDTWAAPPGTSASSPAKCWTVLSYVYTKSTTMEGCHGTQLD